MNHLIDIANTENSIYKLCRLGFDSQARILLRNLDERLMQTVVLFSNGDDFNKWQVARDETESKQAHYEIFSKKGSLLKKHGKIEQDIFDYKSGEMEVRQIRKTESEKLSMHTHGASNSILSSAWRAIPDSENETRYIPNFLGGFSYNSDETVSETFWRVWYFLKTFRLVLFKYHNWKQDVSNENILAFEFYRFISHELMSEWAEKEITPAP